LLIFDLHGFGLVVPDAAIRQRFETLLFALFTRAEEFPVRANADAESVTGLAGSCQPLQGPLPGLASAS
jgi:hypothetical protein